jgi:hypothetical protein
LRIVGDAAIVTYVRVVQKLDSQARPGVLRWKRESGENRAG